MNQVKRFFPIPLLLVLIGCSAYAVYQMAFESFQLRWLGVFLATTPMAAFFGYLGVANVARTHPILFVQIGGAVTGTVLTLVDFNLTTFAMAAIPGLIGTMLYNFWYTPLDRSNTQVEKGKLMPEHTFTDINGRQISTTDTGNKRLWIFIRGNWCPLCVAQVDEISAQYKQLADLGTDVFFISSQSQKHSQDLAKRFDAPLGFLVDTDNAGAIALGLDHSSGVPFGLPGYDADTAFPTVIITDENGKVIYLDQTDDYRIRPEPSQFISALSAA
ncbi:Thiol-disulfide oxidoreductase ResA [BD1-7 clade bacterium]|uniref:Thiol-disulfide oxidoreductase ResA n=1 Tax=BD1-7 clade bacterium TaxID=2029982 RepID=A0A5S9MYR4_9GAMM|nr:Thiol-disulfide oxidoreductase ResA [BD1-7 clade bacterium]